MSKEVPYTISSFAIDMKISKIKYKLFHLKGFVYIEKYHTEWLKNYITPECWGNKNKKLYYYLDHTFRINLVNDSINIYHFKNQTIGIYGIKLYKKNSNNELYMIMTPHFSKKNRKWFLSKGVWICLFNIMNVCVGMNMCMI